MLMTDEGERPGQAPVIETARLVLRGHRRDDLADLTALWADPEVIRYIGGRPFTEEESWARLLRYVGHWAVMGFGYWAVVERDSGRFVGDVGLSDHHREIVPALDSELEVGWVLAPWAHGRGYAHEAASAALAWTVDKMGGRPTVCIIDPDNAASIRLANRLGYHQTMVGMYKREPTLMFSRRP